MRHVMSADQKRSTTDCFAVDRCSILNNCTTCGAGPTTRKSYHLADAAGVLVTVTGMIQYTGGVTHYLTKVSKDGDVDADVCLPR